MQIYYFTRTGRSETIANELASKHNTTAHKITDGKDWAGAKNFLRGGFMSSKKQLIEIEYSPVDKADDIILVFPIWAGSFPPAIRSFIEKEGRNSVIAIPTSLASKLKDRDGFKNVVDLIGKQIETPKDI